MGTVCAQTDRHSVSCIVMQRAENVPDAFFRFTLGKTSLFAVFAAESRSARFSGARNKSLHHAPHPAVVPVPYSHRHRRANSGDHFAVFVPQPFRVIDKLAVRESHEVRTYTNFTSFRLSCGLRRSKNRETAGIFGTGCVIVIPSHATLSQLPPGQGCAPTPRQRLTAREKNPRTAHRSRTRQTENRGPRASGVGSDFVIDDGTGKTLGMVVGVTE
ncbi:Uncharacterised protein [Salmonella enterica subsp. enterica serovar Pullorum]|nr:Uncharacterised protein [Salmonella enterica subsp. enterica serovar Pullorum]